MSVQSPLAAADISNASHDRELLKNIAHRLGVEDPDQSAEDLISEIKQKARQSGVTEKSLLGIVKRIGDDVQNVDGTLSEFEQLAKLAEEGRCSEH